MSLECSTKGYGGLQMTNKENAIQDSFSITAVSKSDILYVFKDTDLYQQVKDRVTEMDNTEMESLASKLADDYCTQLFWGSLRIIFEDRFLAERSH
jgi:hypothetical protein